VSDINPSVTRSSLIMASGTIVSRLLGFARAVLLAATIGVTTDAADAFGVANQLPNSVYAIIVGGVLNAVLVPQLVRARAAKDGGKGYIDRFVTLAITVFFVVGLIFTIAAPFLVRLYTAGWTEQQLALATAFAYWCLPQLFFYGIYSVFGEVLNSRSAFGPYMWAPVLNNLVSLGGLAAFIAIFGADPTGARGVADWGADQIALLAGTATLGVAAQSMILLASWRRIGLKLKLNFGWRGFGLGPALKTASWSLAMVFVTQIGGVVQTAVSSTAASARDNGVVVASVAAAAIAWLIFMLPHSVIALVSMISTAILIVLSYPIARVFAGEYPATAALGNVVAAFMIGLVPFSFVYMMQRAFFALEDTKTPFFFTSIQIAIHVTGSLILGATMDKQWLVVSIALLTAFSVSIQGIIAYLALKARIGGLEGFGVGKSLITFFLAMIPAAMIGVLVLNWLGGIGEGSYPVDRAVTAVASGLLVGFAMLFTYLGLLWLFRVPELREVSKQLTIRFGKNSK
jgi:putative peptidoglycan lipid II flippase